MIVGDEFGRVRRIDVEDARMIIDRAMDKANDFAVSGTFTVVDEMGTVISMSRMDGASTAGPAFTRGKAALAAVHQQPSSFIYERLKLLPHLVPSYLGLIHDGFFLGQGGMYIKVDGRIVGGFGSGTGFGPLREVRGVPAEELFAADGSPGNVEDLITAHALGLDYQEFHVGTNLRHRNAGESDEWNVGSGILERSERSSWSSFGRVRPTVTVRLARRLADAGLEEARRRELQIAVVLLDDVGCSVQIDRMVGATSAVLELARERAEQAWSQVRNVPGAVTLRLAEAGTPAGSIGLAAGGSTEIDTELVTHVVEQLVDR